MAPSPAPHAPAFGLSARRQRLLVKRVTRTRRQVGNIIWTDADLVKAVNEGCILFSLRNNRVSLAMRLHAASSLDPIQKCRPGLATATASRRSCQRVGDHSNHGGGNANWPVGRGSRQGDKVHEDDAFGLEDGRDVDCRWSWTSEGMIKQG